MVRRLAGDQRLVSEVLASIASNKPDLFAVVAGETADPVPDPEPLHELGARAATAAPEAVHELLPEDGARG